MGKTNRKHKAKTQKLANKIALIFGAIFFISLTILLTFIYFVSKEAFLEDVKHNLNVSADIESKLFATSLKEKATALECNFLCSNINLSENRLK